MPYKDPEKARQWREAHKTELAEYLVRWRRANPDKTRTREARARARNRAIINAAKNVPCARCSKRYPPCAMDFHHRGGTKEVNVSTLKRTSLERLEREIAKCDVLCANCHRIEHHGGNNA